MPVAAAMRVAASSILLAVAATRVVAQTAAPQPAPMAQTAAPGPVLTVQSTLPLSPTVQPLPGFTADGRYFGHLPYAEAPSEVLATMAQSITPDKSCALHRDAAAALYRLTDAAQAQGVGGLRLISCFRSPARQADLFCSAGLIGACRDPAERARSVAPGRYSEHATGYAVDFGVASYPGCADLEPCMAATPGGQWLLANAPKFGFELSFPPANRQGVTWEPWHWRWVGTSASEFGAAAARTVFSRARRDFPARPAVGGGAPPVRVAVDPRNFVGPRD